MNDTISRQQAIDALLELYCKSDEDGYVWIIRCDACLRIDALPSAQQKGDIEEAVEYIKNVQEYLRDIGETWYANHLSDAIELLVGEMRGETEC